MIEITSRTLQGRYLLKPTSELTQRFLGVVGRAQKLYGVEIHIFTVLSNHYHLLVSVKDAQQLASFMRYVNSNVAREAGRLFDWREAFWGRRYQSILTSEEPAAQLARFRYVLAQGVKEGLVERVRDWPGANCARAWLDDEPLRGIWLDRSAEYEARRRGRSIAPEEFRQPVVVELTPLPCWRGLTREQVREQVERMAREIEIEARDLRLASGEGRPKGRRRLLEVHPHDRPRAWTPKPAPFCHAASRRTRLELREAFNLFTRAYRSASRAWRAGDRSALELFPEGCFLPSLSYRPLAAPV